LSFRTGTGPGPLSTAPARSKLFLVRSLERPSRLVIWTIVVGTAVRLVGAETLGLGYGESYYLATARQFALSYFDQPPLSLWMIWATLQIVGENAFLLRLPFVAMFAGTTWLMYRLGALLFGERAGALAALLLNLAPVFTISVAGWLQPDGPLMLLLLAAMLPVARLACEPPPLPRLRLWIEAGLWFGLALLAKYHAALLIGGLAIFALTSPRHRTWFREPGPYLAGVIMAALFSPVVIWNLQHDWASFAFQSGRIVEQQGIQPLWFLRSIIGQALWLGPWIFAPLIYVYGRALAAGPRETRAWLLACAATIPIVLFTAAALWAPLGLHFHWQAPGYLMLFPLLGAFAARLLEDGRRGAQAWLVASTVAILIAGVLLITQARFAWVQHLAPAALRDKVSNVQDPTMEAHDWKELRPELQRLGLLDQAPLFVVTSRWHQAGKVDAQIGDKLPVVCLCEDPRNIAFSYDLRSFTGQDAIVIGTDAYRDGVPEIYAPYFESIEPIQSVAIRRAGRTEMTLHLYRAKAYRGNYPIPLPPSAARSAQPEQR
jgi:hypothetical protein